MTLVRGSLHDRLVETILASEAALEDLGFELIDCVLSCNAACLRDFAEDAEKAAQAWVDPEATGTVTITRRDALRAEEVHEFFGGFMTAHHHGGRPRAEIAGAVAEVFRSLTAVLERMRPEARWYSVAVPCRSTSGARRDIVSVDVAAAFDGAVTCIHLGYSD